MADTEIPQARLEDKALSERIFEQRRRIRNRMQSTSLAKFPLPAEDQVELSTIDLLLIDIEADRRARSSLMDVAVEALDKMAQPLTFAGNVAYNMKQTTSTVESAREFERINGWVDEVLAIRRTALQAISASRNTGGDDAQE